MIEVIRAAAELQSLCDSQDWRFCFIGGLALQRWGEPRETIDVDLTLLTGFGGEEPFVRTLLQHFEPRIPDAADSPSRGEFCSAQEPLAPAWVWICARRVAVRGIGRCQIKSFRVSATNVPCALARPKSTHRVEGLCRPRQDRLDVEGIIIRQTGKLDWVYIRSQLQPLAELKKHRKSWTNSNKRRVEFEQ